MVKIKEYYQKSFDISSNKQKEENNINRIIESNNKNIYVLKKILFIFILLITISSGSVLAINTIKRFNTLNVEVKDNKPYIKSISKKEINYNANYLECNGISSCKDQISKLSDIENNLGIKILKNKEIQKKDFIPTKVIKNENYISEMGFLTEWVEYEKYMIARFSFSFKTKYSDNINDKVELPFSNKYQTIYCKKINTDILVSEEENSYRLTFDYDDVNYNILIFIKNDFKGNKDRCINEFINSLTN